MISANGNTNRRQLSLCSAPEENVLDAELMARALTIAEKGRGTTRPNPMVGAVIVKDGVIVGEGYHQRAGEPHAEIYALREAGEKARGATMYVTLEPCSHWGRTPPCAEAIIEAGIKRVVVAMIDPNPKVSGRGVELLRQAGIEVEVGLGREEAARLNEVFLTYIQRKRPFVLLKAGMSLDGKVAAATGDTKYITGPEARAEVHRLRREYAAILVGVNTVLADDPSLTARTGADLEIELPEAHQPVRIIVDTHLRVPVTARVVSGNLPGRTIIASVEPDRARKLELERHGVEVWGFPKDSSGMVPLGDLLARLAAEQISSLLVEGGPTVHWSFLQEGLADKILFFYAPVLIGGREAPSAIEGRGFPNVGSALRLRSVTWREFGDDLAVEGYVRAEGGEGPCLRES